MTASLSNLIPPCFYNLTNLVSGSTLAALGLEEPCASFPDLCNNRQFPVINVFPLVYVLYFISKNF